MNDPAQKTQPGDGGTRDTNSCSCQKCSSGVLPIAFICITVAFVSYLFLHHAAEKPRRLWIPVVFQTNGVATVLGETRQLEFWTPSAKTKDFMTRQSGEIADSDRWEILDSEDRVMEFGMKLHNDPDVLGYRRNEVWGHGRTDFKPGWWWTMSVTTNYSVKELDRVYQDFWKSGKTVYVEVIDNRGRED
jgi:hypothetical protein